jgi:hypothetical protein
LIKPSIWNTGHLVGGAHYRSGPLVRWIHACRIGRPALDLGGGIFVVPVLHERLESAVMVRRALQELSPDAVAVEVPSSLSAVFMRAIERLPAISVLLYETEAGDTIYLPIQPADPVVEAARWALERDRPVACADLDVDGYADHRDPFPDPYAITRIGLLAYADAVLRKASPADAQDARREAAMAYHVRALADAGARRVLAVIGMRHLRRFAAAVAVPQAAPLTPPARKNVRLVHLHPESLGEVLGDPPFYIAAYEARRAGLKPSGPRGAPAAPGRDYGAFRVVTGGRGDDPARVLNAVAVAAQLSGDSLDRLRLQNALVAEASKALVSAAPDERVEPWQRKNLARFCSRLARHSGMLVADLYDLVVAARACASENFAWELHRLATSYPWQEPSAKSVPTARIRADEMWDDVRRVRLRRRIKREKTKRPESVLRRKRRDERFPGEWLAAFDKDAICSYPPEDRIVEAFGGFLRKKGKAVLAEDSARVLPFTTSVLDGIDVRETIRHWAERQIYVRESGRTPGDIGVVVVIFDDDVDPGQERYPYRLTWLGEHGQESDMAFYATPPERAIVGPGICRVTYGGFLLSYPPGRLVDVWGDADYRFAETKAEVLLLAALDYSRERIVVHAAPKPPRAIFHQIAARLDRRILHLPIGTLSPRNHSKDPRHARPVRPREARNCNGLRLVVAATAIAPYDDIAARVGTADMASAGSVKGTPWTGSTDTRVTRSLRATIAIAIVSVIEGRARRRHRWRRSRNSNNDLSSCDAARGERGLALPELRSQRSRFGDHHRGKPLPALRYGPARLPGL